MLATELQPMEKLVPDLARDMPGIGIQNKKKRIQSFLSVCKMATELTSNRNNADACGVELLHLFLEINKDFCKSTQTVILNLERIEVSSLGVVGTDFVWEVCSRRGIRPYFRHMVPDGFEEPALG